VREEEGRRSGVYRAEDKILNLKHTLQIFGIQKLALAKFIFGLFLHREFIEAIFSCKT
jgi:hypothetical protein